MLSRNFYEPDPEWLIHRDQLPVLREALADQRNRLLAIIGRGGTGKTVLAQQLLSEVTAQYPGGICGISGYALTQEQFELELSQLRVVAQSRPGRKILLIDGADTQSADRLSAIFDPVYLQVVEAQLLITSRFPVQGVDYSLELGPMSLSERRHLWGAYNFNMGPQGLDSLFKLSHGHLLTERLLGEAIREGQISLDEIDAYLRDFNSPGIVDRNGNPVKNLSQKSALVTSFTGINDDVFKLFAKSPHLLYKLTSRQFEEFVAELFSRQGYDVQLTPQSSDGGKDMYIATRSDLGTLLYVVECKKYAPDRPVGIELVRHLYGVVESERVTGGILATTSRFTSGAKRFQESYRARLSLKDYIDIQKLLHKSMRPQ